MIETLDAVSLEGRVFRQVLVAAPGAAPGRPGVIEEHEPLPQVRTDRGAEVGFITCKVMRDMRRKYVFRAGGLPVLLWGRAPFDVHAGVAREAAEHCKPDEGSPPGGFPSQ